uniref:NADH dehydrogenase subunit 4 n=1 Tax=Zanna robusticephalica TaxID=3081104 RepID=UPI002A7F65BB|nr:NADH dehydrogenase subunit 4 [Zanna robusticephalica]WOW98861.1 NADH dehydrogenase subunit 4 [Zanna robusticephalica]
MLKFIFFMLALILSSGLNNWLCYILGFFFFFFFFFFCGVGYDFYWCISYNFMLDKVSFLFICLSLWIFILVFLSIYEFYYCDNNFYLLCVYLGMLFFFLLFDFLVIDFFSFYFFFECSLIPLFLIIFGWGYQPERLGAGIFLIFYTLFGSFPFFISIIYLIDFFGSFSFILVYKILNNYLVFFVIFSFLISFPCFGVHLWLPKAHVEAHSSGSMILAGVMLKLGGYGFIRFLPFCYEFLYNYSYFFIAVCLLGCFYISVYCLIQSDLSMLIAYSSVCHMSVVICGLVTMTSLGLVGSLYFMVAHGFVSSGLFFLVGLVYDRLGSRSFFLVKGLMSFIPSLSLFWFFFCIMNMSCPPSLNLFSEICLVVSLISWSFLTIFFLLFILFLSACYSMMIYSFTQHGEFSSDLIFFSFCNVREYLVLVLHMFPIFFMMVDLMFFY